MSVETKTPGRAPVQVRAIETYRNFIDGKWVASASTRTVLDVNPADTRDALGLAPLSTVDEARSAVAAAKAALPGWRATPAPVRGNLLFKAWSILTEEKEELARLLTREEGKTLKESRGEIQRALNVLEYTAGTGRRLVGETVPSELPRNFCYTVREPHGVVVCITPWNFPVAIPIWKIAPALLCGNTVVFKPATLTPATAVAVVRAFERAGLPAGTLNLVLGSGSSVGDALLKHEDVRAVSFTGSNDVGLALYQQVAGRGTRVQCEMGGKNPVVVLADADLDLAVEATVQGAFGSTGQRCTATSRVIVEEAVADEFVARLAARTRKLRVGNGSSEGVDVGPAVDEQQFETDLRYIEIARGEGAELVCGGRRLGEGELAHGYYLEPTLFDRVTPQMRIAQEEVFGPVLCVLRVASFDEAMSVANGVRYGLSAAIFSADTSRAFEFVDRIEAGIVHINSGTPGGEAHLPFGGLKATGVGPREQGSSAIEFWSEVKVVYVDYTGQSRKSSVY